MQKKVSESLYNFLCTELLVTNSRQATVRGHDTGKVDQLFNITVMHEKVIFGEFAPNQILFSVRYPGCWSSAMLVVLPLLRVFW